VGSDPRSSFRVGLWLDMMIDSGRNTPSCVPDEALAIARGRLNGSMKHPNLFLLRRNGGHPPAGEISHLLSQGLRRKFRIEVFDLPPAGVSRKNGPAEYCCIAVDSSQPERVRDVIKQQLWLARPQTRASTGLEDVLRGQHEKTAREFRLEEYGLFVPCRTRRHTDIRTHSFDHEPAFYRYRVALARTAELPEPPVPPDDLPRLARPP
jgi:hypothetical protein